MNAKITTVLICDDVRKEDNGKHICVGVYAGVIFAPVIPTIFPTFALYFEVTPQGISKSVLTIVVRAPDGSELLRAVGDIEFAETHTSSFFYKHSPVALPAEGEYTILAGFDAEPEPIRTFTLRKGAAPS
jgi:hypothetical protein